MVHAVKGRAGLRLSAGPVGPRQFWDFISLTPESMHMIVARVMSDRAIPHVRFDSWKVFGVHTFALVNAKNESTFC